MRKIKFLTCVFFGMALILSAPSAESSPVFDAPKGYKSDLYFSHSGLIQGFDFDAAGSLYVYKDNRYITKYNGGETVLYDYGNSDNYGSFLSVNGGTVYFGESTSGSVKCVSTSGGAAAELFSLAGNYDMAFNSAGGVFLSANPGGYSPENKIYYWNGDSLDLIAAVGGYAGPLAFDRNDNLFYGFPDWGAGKVVCFQSTQISSAIAQNNFGAAELDGDDWTQYVTGLDAASGFIFDNDIDEQDLFSASWQGTITSIDGENLYCSFASADSPSFMRFIPGTENFEPYAGADGGELYVLTTNWSSMESAIYKVTPTTVPEPGTFVLLGAGLASLFALKKRNLSASRGRQ